MPKVIYTATANKYIFIGGCSIYSLGDEYILLFKGNYIAGLRVIFYNQSEMKCDTLRSLPSQNKMPNAVFTQST